MKRAIRRALGLLPLVAVQAMPQCVMCFRTAEAQNSARAHVLNMGIVLLGLPPFMILAGFCALAWRRSRVYDQHDMAVECQEEPVAVEFKVT